MELIWGAEEQVQEDMTLQIAVDTDKKRNFYVVYKDGMYYVLDSALEFVYYLAGHEALLVGKFEKIEDFEKMKLLWKD